jgi:hypothetical protein
MQIAASIRRVNIALSPLQQVWFRRMERRFSSLAGCYALLAALAALFLVYAHLAFLPSPSGSSIQIGSLVSRLQELIFDHPFHASRAFSGALAAASALRERMHTTWLFFGVFAAVWLISLLWMLIERRRLGFGFNLREAYWMGWISLSVFSVAVLYGVGTNGLLTQRFPEVVAISDLLAIGFMLSLPVLAWSQLHRAGPPESEDEVAVLPRRNRGILGLSDNEAGAHLMENFSRLKVVQVEPLPSVQIFHPEVADEHTKVTVDRLIERAELPTMSQASGVQSLPPLIEERSLPAPQPAPQNAATKGVEHFRDNLTTLNISWRRIETIGAEIEQWFDQQRRQAIAHLEMPPGLRGPELSLNLSRDFPGEKLAAVDIEWAEIRRAALEISRWFGDAPARDREN